MRDQADRAAGALLGLAVGDALGMPTQLLARAEVVARYGPVLDGFHPGPAGHPIAAGLPAGTVTDDTEQAMLLARLLVAGGGRVDPLDWARALAEWEHGMRRRGSADLLGPSTRAALAAIARGTAPAEAGAHGDTNGAAMRIAPVGIATPVHDPSDPASLVEAVATVSRVTHGTDIALAGATAVAAAVSTGVAGGTVRDALAAAVTRAPAGAAAGRPTGAPPLAPLIAHAVSEFAGAEPATASDLADRIAAEVGTGLAVAESVPAAFAVLAALPDDPWAACRVAASLGGDSDTIAAMAGAIGGACHGADAFPAPVLDRVRRANPDVLADLDALAADLLAIRGAVS